jgi:hypothetical protein
MGKKRNGVANKLKGPAKWQKGSKEARKIQQSKRDAKLAKAAKEGIPLAAAAALAAASQGPGRGSAKRYKRIHGASLSAAKQPQPQPPTQQQLLPPPSQPAAGAAPSGQEQPAGENGVVPPDLGSAIELHLATDAGWARLRDWMLPRLQHCCDVDAAVIAQYTTDLLRAKPAAQWQEALPRELATFARSEEAAQALAAETLGAICDGSATAAPLSSDQAAAGGPTANTQTPTATKQATKKKKKHQKKRRREKDEAEKTSKSKKAGWVAATDASSGQVYYYHTKTRETSWEEPPELQQRDRT